MPRLADAAHVIAGAILSFTVIVKLQVVLLPEASVTVHTTVLAPWLNTAPSRVELLFLLLVTEATLQLSEVATGLNSVPCTVYVHVLLSVPRLAEVAQVIAGAILSFTVIVTLQVVLLPETSVTVHITVLAPLLKTAPASVAVLFLLLVIEATLQLSEVAIGLNSVPCTV